MKIREALHAIQNGTDRTVELRSSGWLEDVEPAELDDLYSAFSADFDHALRELSESLGSPSRTDERDRDWLDSWYPEAIRFAAWDADDGLLTLAVEHQDQEVPVLLLLSRVTQQELRERMA